ncbi:MAG: hypothetical protein ACI37T_02110 [Candidatus Gastranaerophilaceae bacterium]
MLNKVRIILESKYPKELSEKIVKLYSDTLLDFRKKNWKNCISNIGQLNEAFFRVLEYELTGNYIDLKTQLPKFQSGILNHWENVSNKPENLKVIMPRILFGMYCLRNKRGAIHLSSIDPNEIDATVLIQQAKWFLAEIIRINSPLSFDETIKLIKQIICKEIDIIWDTGGKIRILKNDLNTTQKVICLLYYKDGQSENELYENTEYKNFSLFRNRILKSLHQRRFIEYNNKVCKISPLGIIEAEKIFVIK